MMLSPSQRTWLIRTARWATGWFNRPSQSGVTASRVASSRRMRARSTSSSVSTAMTASRAVVSGATTSANIATRSSRLG